MLFAVFAPLATAAPVDAFVGTWESATRLLVTIEKAGAGARVTLRDHAGLLACPAPTLKGATLSCTITHGGWSTQHTFSIVDGGVLLDRRDDPNGGKGWAPLAFARLEPKEADARLLLWRDHQIPGILEDIRQAEMAYDAAFDTFVAASLWPRPLTALDGEAAPFSTAATPGEWQTLGVLLAGTPASFSVEVAADNRSFTVHAWADYDKDGVPQHWTMGPDGLPKRLTPEDVR